MKSPKIALSPNTKTYQKLEKTQEAKETIDKSEDNIAANTTTMTEEQPIASEIGLDSKSETDTEHISETATDHISENDSDNTTDMTLNGNSISVSTTEEESIKEKSTVTEGTTKLITISFPPSETSYASALKNILSHCVKVRKPKPLYIKYTSAAEAEQKQSEIENIAIEGMKLQTKILKSTYDPLKRVTVISSKIHVNMSYVITQLGAISYELLKTSNYIQVYALQFKNEEDSLNADNLSVVVNHYAIRLRPYREQLNKRDIETETSSQNSPKKIKLNDDIEEEEEENVEEDNDLPENEETITEVDIPGNDDDDDDADKE